MDWYQLKIALSQTTGVSQDALHILAGTACQLLIAGLFRLRVSNLLPWAVVLALEVANEWSDLHFEIWPNRGQQWGESIKDMCVTLAVPTAIFLLTRWTPGLFAATQTAQPGRPPLNRP